LGTPRGRHAMASDFAAMLDEMMGPERNIDLDKVTGRRRRFDDDDVDKHHLAGCSPYRLFQGSKKNIGYFDPDEWHKHSRMVCDEACKAEYDALPRAEKHRLGWEHETYKLCVRLITRCDERVRKAQEQLDSYAMRLDVKITERKMGWQTKIDDKMRESEEAGEAGDVDGCQKLIKEADDVRAAMEKDMESYTKELNAKNGFEVVCKVSGAIIGRDATLENDPQGHFSGKNYVGWQKIREFVRELNERTEGPPKPPSDRRDGTDQREGRGGDRDYHRDRHRGDDRSRGGSRDREYREHGRRYSRSPSRDRRGRDDRGYHPYRDGGHDRRGHSRDGYRDQGHDRGRDRR